MNFQVSRRHFMRMAGTGVAGSALGAFGFTEAEAMTAARVKSFKLAKATETRNTCPYCAVGCGVVLYSRGDVKKGEKAEIFHIEGDADHPNQSRDALRKRRGPPRRRELPNPHQISSSSRARHRQVEAAFLGRGAGPHRAPHEGRPRQELHRHEQGRRARQPLDHDRLPRRVRDHQRNRVPDLQGGQKNRHGRVRQPGARLPRPDGGQPGSDIRPRRHDQLADRHQEYRPCDHHGR